MAKYKLIPNAVERITGLMARLHLRPLNPKHTVAQAISDHARFYMGPALKENGQIVWFKTSLQDMVWLRRGLREEMRVQKAFADYERTHHPHFDSPSWLAGGDDHRGGLWLMRKYWQDTYAGDMDTTFGLTNAFLRRVSAKAMAKVLADVRAMSGFMSKRLTLDHHRLDWYLLDFHYYRRHFFPQWLKHKLNPGWNKADVSGLEKVLRDHKLFFNRQAKTFTHGDMYPNNIMVRGGRRPVVLFDWELSHLNLPTFDVVMMYLQAWRQPRWQKAFSDETIRLLGGAEMAKTAWRLSMISLATRLTAFCFLRLTNGQPDRYPPLPRQYRSVMMTMYKRNLAHLQAANDNTLL